MNNLRAFRPGANARRPRAYSDDRVCERDGCKTILSRYNKADFCHRHAPVNFPRLRGVISET